MARQLSFDHLVTPVRSAGRGAVGISAPVSFFQKGAALQAAEKLQFDVDVRKGTTSQLAVSSDSTKMCERAGLYRLRKSSNLT